MCYKIVTVSSKMTFKRVLALDDLHVVCNLLARISADLFAIELVLHFYGEDLAEF